jgi:SHS2 domain-containing protein
MSARDLGAPTLRLLASSRPMGFQEIEHTGDCAIRVWADDLPGLFVRAAQGLYQVSGSRFGPGKRTERRLKLHADDAEGLLVVFLSELIYRQEHEDLGFDTFDLRVDRNRLVGKMHGRKLTAIARPLKAVTYHGLRIDRSDPGYTCELVFDV